MENFVINIIIAVLILAIIYYMNTLSKSEASYVSSDLTNREYLVQNLDNKEEASYMLSVIHQRIFLLKDHLHKNIDQYPKYKPYIEQFCSRINNVVLLENPPDGKYTSYTVNKGDEIALCLRSRKDGQLHDINLIMYVVLHELAHVACPEKDHTELFKEIFIFFIRVAESIQIYKIVDYQIDPHEYCGLIIRENLTPTTPRNLSKQPVRKIHNYNRIKYR